MICRSLENSSLYKIFLLHRMRETDKSGSKSKTPRVYLFSTNNVCFNFIIIEQPKLSSRFNNKECLMRKCCLLNRINKD